MSEQPTSLDQSMLDESISAAVQSWARGDQAGALLQTNALLDQYPRNEQVLLAHTGLLLHKKDHATVRKLLEPEQQQGDLAPGLMANLSIALRGCGEYGLAIEVAKALVEQAPDKPSGWNALGLAWMELEKWDKAEDAFARGLSYHPDHPALRHHRNQALEKLEKPTPHHALDASADLLLHAQSFSKQGNPVAAEAALRQAISFRPNFFASHGSLGTFLMRYGRSDEARPHLEQAHSLNPGCATTKLFLDLARGEKQPDPSAQYIEQLFDSYADHFDDHLVKDLEYAVPKLLSEQLLDRLSEPSTSKVLDLGCGTGLVGEHLAHRIQSLDGVDLSEQMLDQAAKRSCYQTLTKAEIRDFLNASPGPWDGLIAADVFIYCGDIEDIIRLCHQRLAANGVLAFSVESCAGDDYQADPSTGRYQHPESYLKKTMGSLFEDIHFMDQVLRKNSGEPVKGQLILARLT